MIIKTDNGFQITINGYRIIEHSSSSPFIAMGKGYEKFKVNKGSYKIKDDLLQKTYLTEFDIVEQSEMKAVIQYKDLLTVIFEMINGRLEISFSCRDRSFNRMWINLVSTKKEKIYGCGEQYTYLNLKGKKVPLWCQEQGIGRGKDIISIGAELTHGAAGRWYTTYFAQPTYISSNNYFVHVDTFNYCEFDFKDQDLAVLEIWNIPNKIIIDKQDNAPLVLDSLTQMLGRQPEMPDWCYDGIWLGVQGGIDEIKQKLQKALDANIKVGAVWAQDWQGIKMTYFGKQLFWNWKYSNELYPDLPEHIKQLNEKQIQFLGYINPHLEPGGKLYKEAKEKEYLVKNDSGEDYITEVSTFPVGFVDLSNPGARNWIKDVIKKNMIAIGQGGWMADFSESFPVDAVLHSGEDAKSFHNRYTYEWVKVNYEALEESGKIGKIIFFNRAGFTGISRYSTMMWAGDQNVNWSFDDGLATVIPAGLSVGFCGIGLHHSDIGGYTTVGYLKRSKELFMRWAEQSAFTMLMRTHEGNRPERNWQFYSDKKTLAHLKKMTDVHIALKPYLKTIMKEYREKGLPAMRHPYIHYENDRMLHKLQYQYLFGRDLLVAPVVKKGKHKRKVYLPEDSWKHLWSGNDYNQGWIKINAPIGQPPVFYRKDSQYKEIFSSLAR